MSLLDRTVMVDPGELTRDVVELLRLRAAQLLGDARDRRLSFGSIAVLARSVIARR
jgi:hypothetical protein